MRQLEFVFDPVGKVAGLGFRFLKQRDQTADPLTLVMQRALNVHKMIVGEAQRPNTSPTRRDT